MFKQRLLSFLVSGPQPVGVGSASWPGAWENHVVPGMKPQVPIGKACALVLGLISPAQEGTSFYFSGGGGAG